MHCNESSKSNEHNFALDGGKSHQHHCSPKKLAPVTSPCILLLGTSLGETGRRRMFVTSQFVTSDHFVTYSQIATVSFNIVTMKIVTNL